MLTISPRGGLCNRMRAIVSAAGLCESLGKKMYIDWRRKPELNCKFDELFEINLPIKIRNDLKLFDKFKSIRIAPRFDVVLPIQEMDYLIDNRFDLLSLKKYNSIYIETYRNFFETSISYEILKPIGQIRRIADELTHEFDEFVVGVHLRRSDNFKSIQSSTIEGFIAAMESELKANNLAKFFLATDSKDDESYIKSIFGHKIFTYEKILDRNSPKGIQDALVDLICLSKTRKIIGSYWSTFSEVAAQIGGVELVVINNGLCR